MIRLVKTLQCWHGLHGSRVGVRTVAVFEGIKGLLVLAAAFGLLSLLHRDVEAFAEHVVRNFHLNPASHYPRIFLTAVAHADDRKLWLLALGAFAYAAFRLVEAYGLWRLRAWAEWLAIISSGLYVPLEIYEVFHRITAIKLGLLVMNIGIVLYLVEVRRGNRRERELALQEVSENPPL